MIVLIIYNLGGIIAVLLSIKDCSTNHQESQLRWDEHPTKLHWSADASIHALSYIMSWMAVFVLIFRIIESEHNLKETQAKKNKNL